jgi:hypothetical protein
MPWPIVSDAFLTALGIQALFAVIGHFMGFIGRHFGAISVIASAVLGFVFGVWSNPTPPAISGLGGALVTGGSVLVAGVIVLLLKDARVGTVAWVFLLGTLIGVISAAFGSIVGRSVFGS